MFRPMPGRGKSRCPNGECCDESHVGNAYCEVGKQSINDVKFMKEKTINGLTLK